LFLLQLPPSPLQRRRHLPEPSVCVPASKHSRFVRQFRAHTSLQARKAADVVPSRPAPAVSAVGAAASTSILVPSSPPSSARARFQKVSVAAASMPITRDRSSRSNAQPPAGANLSQCRKAAQEVAKAAANPKKGHTKGNPNPPSCVIPKGIAKARGKGKVVQKGPHGHRLCRHGRRKAQCVACKGSSICTHGRQKHKCKDCGGEWGGGARCVVCH